MDLFIDSIAVHRLGKAIQDYLQEIEREYGKPKKEHDLNKRFKWLYYMGEITKEQYIFLHTQVLLNDFCKGVEMEIGKGVRTGFLFYCNDREKLYYGAGVNYPEPLQELLHDYTPEVDIKEGFEGELFIAPNVDTCHQAGVYDIVDKSQEANIKTLISRRMRQNDFIFGTFELCFPVPLTEQKIESIVSMIDTKLPPIMEELYHLRHEMIETLVKKEATV